MKSIPDRRRGYEIALTTTWRIEPMIAAEVTHMFTNLAVVVAKAPQINCIDKQRFECRLIESVRQRAATPSAES